jgi:hypothetical protein
MAALVRGASEDFMAVQTVRLARLFNRWVGPKGAKRFERGRFDIGRTKGLQDFILRDPSDPLIPGTEVRRLELTYVGEKIALVSEAEIERVTEGLRRYSERQQRAQCKQTARRDEHEQAAAAIK